MTEKYLAIEKEGVSKFSVGEYENQEEAREQLDGSDHKGILVIKDTLEIIPKGRTPDEEENGLLIQYLREWFKKYHHPNAISELPSREFQLDREDRRPDDLDEEERVIERQLKKMRKADTNEERRARQRSIIAIQQGGKKRF